MSALRPSDGGQKPPRPGLLGLLEVFFLAMSVPLLVQAAVQPNMLALWAGIMCLLAACPQEWWNAVFRSFR